jgi:hypothetical protein
LPFSYSVPLSTFSDLFASTDHRLKGELSERLRTELHSSLSQLMTGPKVQTLYGLSSGPFESSVFGDSIVLYSPNEIAQAIQSAGQPRPGLFGAVNPVLRRFLSRKPKALAEQDEWRYPGGAQGGLFSAAVNRVVSRQNVLREEFKQKSKELR